MIQESYEKHDVTDSFLNKWKKTVDLMANLFDVPGGLIMRVSEKEIEVLVSSETEGNPYEVNEKVKLNTGLYCETVMKTRSQLHVPNALEDPEWENNPDVELNMISYLGVPLLWPDNSVFGTLCILDKQTRNYSKDYESLLMQFKEVIESDFKMIVELEQARTTQKSIMPRVIKAIPGVEISYKYKPMIEIGGDFYNLIELKDNKYGIVIGDVTGHGISAALVSFMFYTIFKNSIDSDILPSDVLKSCNTFLEKNLPKAKLVSVIYGIYDSKEKKILYSNAGHPPVIVIRGSKEIIKLEPTGCLIGVLSENNFDITDKEFYFLPGDKILFYTDGIIEQRDSVGEILGSKKFDEFLKNNSKLAIHDLIEQAYEYCEKYSQSSKFHDDVTLIGLEIH